MAITIPILDRSRKFGYVVWKKNQDFAIQVQLKYLKEAEVIFENKNLGKKKIDWKFRRISIGWRHTRPLPQSKKSYILTLGKDTKLSIKCQ